MTTPFTFRRLLAPLVLLSLGLNACKDDTPDTPPTAAQDELVLVTTTTNGNSSFVTSFKDLSVSSVTNSSARELTPTPYVFVNKNFVYVLPNQFGTVAQRFERTTQGLTPAGELQLPQAADGNNLLFISDTKAYLTLAGLGKIWVLNPTTFTQTGEIDLASYGTGDPNPNPAAMTLRDGKAYVALQQTNSTGIVGAPGADVLIINTATDQVEKRITDPRSAYAGRGGKDDALFVDELGDLYVLCSASFGFAPGQKAGFLRIKSGQTEFDPTYFFSLNDTPLTGVPGNQANFLNELAYAGNGVVYAVANIPGAVSSPPNYLTDRSYQPVRLNLRTKTLEKLDLPASNAYASDVVFYQNKAVFALATNAANGLYTFDPATNQASAAPVVTTQGFPSSIRKF